MPSLQRLDAEHTEASLEFEVMNRQHFAQSITDRGDDFFEHFDEILQERLAEQEAGEGAYHVLVDEDGSILGRFNLIVEGDGAAELGFRMAERAAGRGLATAAVRELCERAPGEYGVRRVRAACAVENLASAAVLRQAGFVAVGPAAPEDVGGKPGTWYERVLVS